MPNIYYGDMPETIRNAPNQALLIIADGVASGPETEKARAQRHSHPGMMP